MIDIIVSILFWAAIAIAVVIGGSVLVGALVVWAAKRQQRNPHD